MRFWGESIAAIARDRPTRGYRGAARNPTFDTCARQVVSQLGLVRHHRRSSARAEVDVVGEGPSAGSALRSCRARLGRSRACWPTASTAAAHDSRRTCARVVVLGFLFRPQPRDCCVVSADLAPPPFSASSSRRARALPSIVRNATSSRQPLSSVTLSAMLTLARPWASPVTDFLARRPFLITPDLLSLPCSSARRLPQGAAPQRRSPWRRRSRHGPLEGLRYVCRGRAVALLLFHSGVVLGGLRRCAGFGERSSVRLPGALGARRSG